MTIDSPKRYPANTAISRIGRLAKRWPIFFLENDWMWAKKCILLESNYTLGIDSVRSLEGPISTSLLPRFTSYERRQWLFKNSKGRGKDKPPNIMFQLITKFWQAWRFALLLIYDGIASVKYFVKLQVSMNTSDLSGGNSRSFTQGSGAPRYISVP